MRRGRSRRQAETRGAPGQMIASTSDPILLSPPSPSPLSPTLSATQALLYQASCRQALACRRHRRPRSSPTSRPLTSTIHLTARFFVTARLVTARFVTARFLAAIPPPADRASAWRSTEHVVRGGRGVAAARVERTGDAARRLRREHDLRAAHSAGAAGVAQGDGGRGGEEGRRRDASAAAAHDAGDEP